MNAVTITLANDFHDSETRMRVEPGKALSLKQVRLATRNLCGVDDCTCGDILGQRGPQGHDWSFVPAGDGRIIPESGAKF